MKCSLSAAQRSSIQPPGWEQGSRQRRTPCRAGLRDAPATRTRCARRMADARSGERRAQAAAPWASPLLHSARGGHAAAAAAGVGAAAPAAAQQHIILAPPRDNTAPPETECLLVLVPGAGLGPKDFTALAEAAQARAPHVRLWAACMALDYAAAGAAFARQQQPAGGASAGGGAPAAAAAAAAAADSANAAGAKSPMEAYLEQLLSEVREAAAAAGFTPRMSGWGRCTNLYMCGQSAGGVTFAEAAFKGACGLILLASTIDGRYALGKLSSLEDYGRPIMILGGELDGQMRWPWQAPLAADAAVLAQKAGPSYAAAHAPFVLLPGVNHAQTSNGVPNYARGDIPATASDAAATAALGAAVAAFVTSHQAAQKSERQGAAGELLLLVRQTAELLAPYFMATGMGDVCAAWVTGRQGGPEATASVDALQGGSSSSSSPRAQHQHEHQQQQQPHHHHVASHPSSSLQQPLLQGARREVAARVSGALHPGAVQKAERFVAAAQLKLASTLPREVQGRLRVVVHTHTDVEALLLNQPRVQEQPDGSVVVAVHALLALPNVVRPGAKLPSCQPAAPEYWLKLKRPQAIADELGLPGSYADGTTAAALNSDALQAALAATPQAAAQRYRAAGWQLAVGPDMATPDYNAEKFIRQGALKFTVQPGAGAGGAHAAAGGGGGPGQVVVQAPVLTSRSVGEVRAAAAAAAAAPAGGGGDAASAAMAAAARDPYMVRFLGNWYTKVLSVAQAMEWVMLDSLRQDVTWGGGDAAGSA